MLKKRPFPTFGISGFSLIEVMIAGAVASALMLALVSQSKSNLKMVARINQMSEYTIKAGIAAAQLRFMSNADCPKLLIGNITSGSTPYLTFYRNTTQTLTEIDVAGTPFQGGVFYLRLNTLDSACFNDPNKLCTADLNLVMEDKINLATPMRSKRLSNLYYTVNTTSNRILQCGFQSFTPQIL